MLVLAYLILILLHIEPTTANKRKPQEKIEIPINIEIGITYTIDDRFDVFQKCDIVCVHVCMPYALSCMSLLLIRAVQRGLGGPKLIRLDCACCSSGTERGATWLRKSRTYHSWQCAKCNLYLKYSIPPHPIPHTSYLIKVRDFKWSVVIIGAMTSYLRHLVVMWYCSFETEGRFAFRNCHAMYRGTRFLQQSLIMIYNDLIAEFWT